MKSWFCHGLEQLGLGVGLGPGGVAGEAFVAVGAARVGPVVGDGAADDGEVDFDGVDGLGRDGEWVVGEEDEVAEFAGGDGAFVVFFEGEAGAIDGHHAEGGFGVDAFVGAEGVAFSGVAVDGNVDVEEGVDGGDPPIGVADEGDAALLGGAKRGDARTSIGAEEAVAVAGAPVVDVEVEEGDVDAEAGDAV